MSDRRMFSQAIVGSDAFLDMPVSSQVLYFHLAMRADDDGFVSPKMVMRLIGSSEDDLKVLIAKRFILPFDSGVVVIKHWLIHNLLRSDLYKETLYKKEKEMLGLNENGAYTELREGVSELKKIQPPEWLLRRKGELRTADVPQTARRLGKVSLGQDSLVQESKEKKSRFAPPSLEDVKNYCLERNNHIDAETFVNFYASKGWKVGNSPMKDWKACVHTWEKRNTTPNNSKNITTNLSKYDKLN